MVKECCKVAENRVVHSQVENAHGVITTRVCSVCKCRHIEMEAKPGAYFTDVKAMKR